MVFVLQQGRAWPSQDTVRTARCGAQLHMTFLLRRMLLPLTFHA
jgi:hypothetical protein